MVLGTEYLSFTQLAQIQSPESHKVQILKARSKPCIYWGAGEGCRHWIMIYKRKKEIYKYTRTFFNLKKLLK